MVRRWSASLDRYICGSLVDYLTTLVRPQLLKRSFSPGDGIHDIGLPPLPPGFSFPTALHSLFLQKVLKEPQTLLPQAHSGHLGCAVVITVNLLLV